MSADTFTPEDRESIEFWLELPKSVAPTPDEVQRLLEAHDALVAALRGVMPILDRAESNASGNPEWEAVSARINAARATIAKAAA